MTLDGSEYFTSESIQCEKCLYKKPKKGNVRYHHQILQATLVHPDMRQVIPFAPEFIRNEDGHTKQDCEQNATKRLIPRIKKNHPHLPIIIVGDSLYSKQPTIAEIKKYGFSYILVAKPLDHKSLYADVDGLRGEGLLEKIVIKTKKRIYVYEFANEVPLNGNKDSPLVGFIQLSIYNGDKLTFRNAWVTDIPITHENAVEIVRGGRARWKIENECFNTLKNHGYHLDHNFGHGKKNLAEALFLLNMLAFYFHQIFDLTDSLYRTARAEFSARVEFWNTIRVVFRFFHFESWEEILIKINSS